MICFQSAVKESYAITAWLRGSRDHSWDWFLSGWYFAAANGQHPGYYSSPTQTVVVKKGDPDWWLGVAVDLAEALNGIAFNSKLDVKLDCSESAGFEMGYAFIYYLKV